MDTLSLFLTASLCLCASVASLSGSDAEPPAAELVQVRKVWDRAPHNAFADLAWFRNRWYCVLREGQAHESPDGSLRLIQSADGVSWVSQARFTSPAADLRDPRLLVTPDNRLMLCAGATLHPATDVTHETLVWFSRDALHWGPASVIGDPDFWLWSMAWNKGRAYSAGYSVVEHPFTRFYSSADGKSFEVIVDRLLDQEDPSESALAFLADDTCVCLQRRDGGTRSAVVGTARPPYKQWTWKNLGRPIGGPGLIRLPDGRLVAAVRLYDGRVRSSLCWLDATAGTLTEFLPLPSGGDTSYPGLVWRSGRLWVSYHSSHEGKTAIYLAEVRVRAR